LGLFYRKTTNNAAIWGALLSIPIALYFKVGPNGWAEGTAVEFLFPILPWMDQMGLTFVFTALIIVLISYLENKGVDDEKGLILKKELFKTGTAFNMGAFAILIILAFLYTIFW
jgi:SSS family solute:Na+ symporter